MWWVCKTYPRYRTAVKVDSGVHRDSPTALRPFWYFTRPPAPTVEPGRYCGQSTAERRLAGARETGRGGQHPDAQTQLRGCQEANWRVKSRVLLYAGCWVFTTFKGVKSSHHKREERSGDGGRLLPNRDSNCATSCHFTALKGQKCPHRKRGKEQGWREGYCPTGIQTVQPLARLGCPIAPAVLAGAPCIDATAQQGIELCSLSPVSGVLLLPWYWWVLPALTLLPIPNRNSDCSLLGVLWLPW